MRTAAPAQIQQAARAAHLGGMLGNQLFGQLKGKLVGTHGQLLSFAKDAHCSLMKGAVSWIIRAFLSGYSTRTQAGMAELVDALDSKSSIGDNVGVRFPLPAPSTQ